MQITNRVKKQTYEVGVKCLFCKEALDPQLRDGGGADLSAPSAEDGNDVEDAQAGEAGTGSEENGDAQQQVGGEDEAKGPEPEPEPRSEDEAHAAIEDALADVPDEEEDSIVQRAAPPQTQTLPVRPAQDEPSSSESSSDEDDEDANLDGWKPRTHGSSTLTPNLNGRARPVPQGKTPQRLTQRVATGTATKKVATEKVVVEQREAVSVTTTTTTHTPKSGGLFGYFGFRKSFGGDGTSE
jgi:hypothetical protein